MNKKVKLLLILHHSPPIHGASKVGDIILNSKEIASNFDTRYIKIKSSDGIENIGKFGISKILKSITLFFNVFFLLCSFRPQKIYFTVSPFGFAFYRDLIISIPIKCYSFFKQCDVFYHYHASGIKEFTSSSKLKLNAEQITLCLTCPFKRYGLQVVYCFLQFIVSIPKLKESPLSLMNT